MWTNIFEKCSRVLEPLNLERLFSPMPAPRNPSRAAIASGQPSSSSIVVASSAGSRDIIIPNGLFDNIKQTFLSQTQLLYVENRRDTDLRRLGKFCGVSTTNLQHRRAEIATAVSHRGAIISKLHQQSANPPLSRPPFDSVAAFVTFVNEHPVPVYPINWTMIVNSEFAPGNERSDGSNAALGEREEVNVDDVRPSMQPHSGESARSQSA